eukprot:TRINITY_DN2766_c0_g1_i1.p1 TRINITY_DN2766_c0_g1~~TRINITY_DN2766_c0_g1_i1.p1  ORF type:complete len:207 (-),score=50.58 TRINITY_DN2766_c0_g1_i1:357-977(-)
MSRLSCTEQRLVDYYRGEGKDDTGRTIHQVWQLEHSQLESGQNFIQWLFPTDEESEFEPDAPVLSLASIQIFREDGVIQSNLLRSLEVMVSFLGLTRVECGDEVEYGRGRTLSKKDVWLRINCGEGNPNWKRLSRVLRCLKICHMVADVTALLGQLESVYAEGLMGDGSASAEAVRDWRSAADLRTDEQLPPVKSDAMCGPGCTLL